MYIPYKQMGSADVNLLISAFFISMLKLYINFKTDEKAEVKKRLSKFKSESVAFISSLLDLYYTRRLKLLVPHVISFQFFSPRNMVTFFIFFNYGTIITNSEYFCYKLSNPLGLFSLIIFSFSVCAFQSLRHLEFIAIIIFANL